MTKQLSHYQSKFQVKQFPIVLILDEVSGEANIGSLFRLADAFNIEKIIFCGIPPNLSSNRLKKTARNTQEQVKFEVFETTSEAVESCKNDGYELFCLEISSDSVAIDSVAYDQYSKIALVIGNEANGISEEILHKSRKNLHINMYGNNSSMNVAQAAGIALFEISKSIVPFDKK
ncbi:MAG: TrmH family RNA methyltransferase [Salegentibacter sp.]